MITISAKRIFLYVTQLIMICFLLVGTSSKIVRADLPDKMFQNDETSFRVNNTETLNISDESVLKYENGTIKALNPGTATIIVTDKNGSVKTNKTIKVLDYTGIEVTANISEYDNDYKDQFMWPIPQKKSRKLPFSVETKVDNHFEIDSLLIKKEGLSKEISGYSLNVSSSNNNNLKVLNGAQMVSAWHSGKSRLSIKYDNLVNSYIDFNIAAKTMTPHITAQTKIRINNKPLNVWDRTIGVEIVGNSNVSSYELYRSKSPSGGFKKVATVKGATSTIYYDESKELKPNTRYYYKARAKLERQNEYGPYSAPVSYWTAPKLIKKGIKYKKKTHIVKWKKVKKVSGYMVVCDYGDKLGYNVFGGQVNYSAKESFFYKKTKVKVKKDSGRWPLFVKQIYPYAKHDGYYYMTGKQLTKKRSTLKISEGHRYVV